MSRARRLATMLQATYDDEPWYGPSLASVLAEIPAGRIHERPVAGAHTVAELLVHIAHWKDVVRRRLEGDAVPDANDTDWPPLEASVTLRELRRSLEEAHGKLADCVAALDEAGLDAQVAGNRISREEIVHGILQHDVYHTGQLSLLVKALRGA